MRRRIVILLMVFGLVLGGPAGTLAGEKYPPDLERIQKRGKLVVLAPIAPDAFPCLMEDEAGNPYGLDLDIARDVADKLGVKLEFIRMGASGDEKVEMIARGEADMATCLGITPQRARKILFTKPYITEHYALVVNRVLDARLGGHAYTRLQEGKSSLAVLRGSVYATMAKQLFPQVHPFICDQTSECRRAVLEGRLHAWLTEELDTIYQFSLHPENAVKLKQIVLNDYPLSGGIAVSWDSLHFNAWLNLYLDLTNHDPRTTNLIRRYLKTNRHP